MARSHNLVTFIRVDTQDYAGAHVKMQDASLLTVVVSLSDTINNIYNVIVFFRDSHMIALKYSIQKAHVIRTHAEMFGMVDATSNTVFSIYLIIKYPVPVVKDLLLVYLTVCLQIVMHLACPYFPAITVPSGQ